MLLSLFRKYGGHAYMIDEPVTQIQHAVDTMRYLARQNATPELQLAGLLHDVGHLGTGKPPITPSQTPIDDKHEEVGARLIQIYGLPPAVYQPVADHVRAKRARLYEKPYLIDQLSKGSRLSLQLQGGPMSRAEYLAFRLSPFFQDAMWLREADDALKDVAPRPDHKAWIEFQLRFHVLLDQVMHEQ